MKSFKATILFRKLNKKYPNTKIFFNSVPATWLKGYQQRGCQGKAIKTAATLNKQCDRVWKDNFFALLVRSSRDSDGSSLGFRAGRLLER